MHGMRKGLSGQSACCPSMRTQVQMVRIHVKGELGGVSAVSILGQQKGRDRRIAGIC